MTAERADTKELTRRGAGCLGSFLISAFAFAVQGPENSQETLSSAQVEAYQRLVDAVPDGGLKKTLEILKPFQNRVALVNEKVIKLQDQSWKVYKRLASIDNPIILLIPDEIFTKIAIQTSKFGGRIGEATVKSVVYIAERRKKSRKKNPT